MKRILLTWLVAINIVWSLGMTSALAKDKVDLVYLEGASEIASTFVVKVVLEEMGYNVTLTAVDVKTLFQSIADGIADGTVTAHLPRTHQEDFNTVKNEVNDLGPNLDGLQMGLVVPSYVKEIDSIHELATQADQFGGQIIGIAPSSELMQKTKTALSKEYYALDSQFQLVEGSEESLLGSLADALDKEQPIVVTGWRPHWKFASKTLKFLNDPANMYGDKEYMSTLVRKGLKEDMPEVYHILDNFSWTLADIEQVMLWNTEAGADPYLNAKRWVQNNPAQLNAWKTFPVYLQRAAYNMNTGKLHIPAVDIFENGIRTGVLKLEMQKLSNSNALTPTFILSDELVVLKSEPISYGSILQRVLERGKLLCGVRADLSLKGFAYCEKPQRNHCKNTDYKGFDIALCRAVAAAVLGDKNAVAFEKLVATERSQALQSGKVDLLTRQTSWTAHREAQWGDFTWIMLYDGQGFMVKAESDLNIFEHLKDETICVTKGSTSEVNLQNSFEMLGWAYTPMPYAKTIEAYKAYTEDKCTAITGDKSALAELRNGSSKHAILEVTISKEPLAPVVPHGDSQWLDIVKIVMMGLINAEELGITQTNVDEMKHFPDPAVKRLLGVKGSFGQSQLGLEVDAIAKAIRAVGHYGEIYERHLGEEGIQLPRGINNLWTWPNGMLYAPPL